MEGGDFAKSTSTISFKDVPTPVENHRRQQGIGIRHRKPACMLPPAGESDSCVAISDDSTRESMPPHKQTASLLSDSQARGSLGTMSPSNEDGTTALQPGKLAAEMQDATEGLRQLRAEMDRHVEESRRDAPPALLSRQMGNGNDATRAELVPRAQGSLDVSRQKQAGDIDGAVVRRNTGDTDDVASSLGERRSAGTYLTSEKNDSDRAIADSLAGRPTALLPPSIQTRAFTNVHPQPMPTLSTAPPPGHFSSLATALSNTRRSDSPPSSDLLGRLSKAPSDAGGHRCTPGTSPAFTGNYRSSLVMPNLRSADVGDERAGTARSYLNGHVTQSPPLQRSVADGKITKGFGTAVDNNSPPTSPRIALSSCAAPSFQHAPLISHAWPEDSAISSAALRANTELIRDRKALPFPNARPVLPTATLARHEDLCHAHPITCADGRDIAAAGLRNSHGLSRLSGATDTASLQSRATLLGSSAPLSRPVTMNSESDYRSLRADVETLLKVNAALQVEVDRANARDIDTNNDHWEAQCRTLQEKVRQLEQEGLHARTAHVCKLEEEVDCLGSLLRTARTQNAEAAEQLAAANAQTAARQQERDAAREEQHALVDELQRSRAQQEEAQSALRDKAEQWECRLQEFDKYKCRIEQAARAEKKLLEEDNRVLEERVRQLEAMTESQREDALATQNIADQSTKQEEFLRSELERYKKEIVLAKEAIRRSSKWERTQILESAERQSRQNSELQNVNEVLRIELDQAQERNRELASEVSTAYDFQKLTSIKASKRSTMEMEDLRQWKTKALLSMQQTRNELEELQIKYDKQLACMRKLQNKSDMQLASVPGSPIENYVPPKKCPLTNAALKKSIRDAQLMIDDSVIPAANRYDNGVVYRGNRGEGSMISRGNCGDGSMILRENRANGSMISTGNRANGSMISTGNRANGSMASKGKKSFLDDTIISMSSHIRDSAHARDSIDSRRDRTGTAKKKTRAKSVPKRAITIERPFR